MPEKVSIRLPAHLAQMVRPDAPDDLKQQVLDGEIDAPVHEWVTQLFFLCYDRDSCIKNTAIIAIRQLSPDQVIDALNSPLLNDKVAELLRRVHPGLGELPSDIGEEAADENDEVPEEEAEVEEEDEEYKSKYQLAQSMGVGDKIKMAMTGDKEWRGLLIKDSNKLVSGAVVKNPRITEPEILTISKSAIQNDEIIRVICHNKEWVKNYEIRKALVLNNKTPLPVALRFMGFLTEKDLGGIAKSKNVSSVISNQARRLLVSKKKS